MFLRWFDSREAVAFAKTVASDIDALLPPGSGPELEKLSRPKEAKRFERILEQVFTFAVEKKLNFYTKARFLNTLLWELRERGHEEAFVKRFIEAVTPRL